MYCRYCRIALGMIVGGTLHTKYWYTLVVHPSVDIDRLVQERHTYKIGVSIPVLIHHFKLGKINDIKHTEKNYESGHNIDLRPLNHKLRRARINQKYT
jgi:hypothetical protein